MGILDAIEKERVIAVLRAESARDALERALASAEGGMGLIEITLSFDGATEAISALSRRRGIRVGAGTVLTLDQARAASAAGAEFLVCPHTDPEIIGFARENDLAIAAGGALTSHEIVGAWKAGADMVKIFPAGALGGADYIRAIKEPLPFVKVMATGGITLDNIGEYLRGGATAVGIGSYLFGSHGRASPESITLRDERIVGALAAGTGA